MFEFRLPKNLKNKKLKYTDFESIEPQEVFLDKLAKNEEYEFGISPRKLEVLLSNRMIKGFFVFSILVILVLFSKTFQYQIFYGAELTAKADENRFVNKSLDSARGVIYDSKWKQLVSNIPSFDLIANKKNLPKQAADRKEVFNLISGIINLSPSDIEKNIDESKDQLVLVKRNLENLQLIVINTKINELAGLEIQQSSTRNYVDGSFFSQIIGYTGKISSDELKATPDIYSPLDYIGRDGLEKSYEKYLRRDTGNLQIERDAFGNIKSREVVASANPGGNLVLWIDADLQKKITEELVNILQTIGGKKAAAVAINPQNGAVLSLVSLPSYDNNLFAKGANPKLVNELFQNPLQPLFDRVISGQYATGSTIKPLTASAALQENIIDPNKELDCNGAISITNRYDPSIVYTYHDWAVHGPSDMRKAIAESCDVYFYTIGGGYKNQKGLGPALIKKYLDFYGWGSKTNIDLPGEVSGFIPSPEWKKRTKNEGWWDGDTYNISIGQGDMKITPLEVATSYQAIANGGTVYKPQIVQKIVDDNKNEIQGFLPQILNSNFIKPENIEVAREGMRQAVTGINTPHASSVLLKSLPVAAAAKTGTAQTSTPNHYHNWITVFAPYDNPQIVLTIILENVPTQAAAIPPARNILEWYFSNK